MLCWRPWIAYYVVSEDGLNFSSQYRFVGFRVCGVFKSGVGAFAAGREGQMKFGLRAQYSFRSGALVSGSFSPEAHLLPKLSTLHPKLYIPTRAAWSMPTLHKGGQTLKIQVSLYTRAG